jgi:hypothetical protein
MNAFNRFVIALFSLAWCAALGVGLWLVWDQSRSIDFTSGGVELAFDIVLSSQAEQILASIIIGALALPALMLLMMQLTPSRRRPVEDKATADRYTRLEREVESLKRQLEHERPRVVDTKIEDKRVDDTRIEPARPHRRWRFLSGARH